MLEPQDYRDVLVIARAETLKAAAQVLALDASTMGRRLERLEERFGARLFLRAARRLELTPEGAAVVEVSEQMEALQLAFERDLMASDPSRAAAVTITSAEWGVPLLTPILARLATRHPGLRLRLRIENRALDLSRREADIALRIGRPTEQALVGKRVGAAKYGLYGARSYLKGRPRLERGKPVTGHVFCSLDATFARVPHVRWQAALAGSTPLVLETNSMLALVEAARQGAGLATLPCVLAERFPELERVLPEAEAVVRDLWLVFHRDLRKSRPMRVITEELIAEVRPIFARDA